MLWQRLAIGACVLSVPVLGRSAIRSMHTGILANLGSCALVLGGSCMYKI